MPRPAATCPRARDVRRAWLLVSVASVAVWATVLLLALVVAALLSGWGAPAAAGYGIAAAAAAGVAGGLLVLARAGVVARRDLRRAKQLCTRCTVGSLAAVVAVLVAGGVAVLLTRSGLPMHGGAAGGVLLVPLVGVAARQRAVVQGEMHAAARASMRAAARRALEASQPPFVPRPRSGGGRESEPRRTAGAR